MPSACRRAVLLLLLVLPLVPRVHAAVVPEPLAPWVDWVKEGDDRFSCPPLYNDGDRLVCAWPGTLDIRPHEKGALFAMDWQVFKETDIPIPGSARLLPEHVLVDGKPVPVSGPPESPVVRIPSGTHEIRGEFAWGAAPEQLPVPAAIGRIRLFRNQQVENDPFRDRNGAVWLAERPPESQPETHRTEFEVFRKIEDGNPIRITTRIHLSASGYRRREVLPVPEITGSLPVRVASPIPLKREADGRLIADVVPGSWDLLLTHVLPEGTTLSTRTPRTGSELWVLETDPEYRNVRLEGAPSIDPTQSRLPGIWKKFPAYRIIPSATPGLVVEHDTQRTDSDHVSLERDLWIDFDGKGATARDRLSGVLAKRTYVGIPADSALVLGRLTRNGTDRRISEFSGIRGLEVPEGRLMLAAVSRMDTPTTGTPVPNGWAFPLEAATTRLHLPPGWRLLSVSGADAPEGATFLTRWTLLDLFVLFLITAIAFRLWGAVWGGILGVALAATFHVLPVPGGFWFLLLSTTALLRYLGTAEDLPDWITPLRPAVTGCHLFFFVIAILVGLHAGTREVRAILYPQLELPVMTAPSPEKALETAVMQDTRDLARLPLPRKTTTARRPKNVTRTQVAPVQTGPGVPEWRWQTVPLEVGFSGPGHALGLRLLSPGANRACSLFRILCILTLLFRFAMGSRGLLLKARRFLPGLLVALLILPLPGLAGEIPSREILDELAERLLPESACAPYCARIPSGTLEVTKTDNGTRLVLILDVEASRETAIPLPTTRPDWHRGRVALDTRTLPPVRKIEGEDWALVSRGVHTLSVESRVPAGPFRLRFPMDPGRLEILAPGFEVDGLQSNGRVPSTIAFIPETEETEAAPLGPSADLVPWVHIDRQLVFETDWKLRSTLKRLAPGAPAPDVPLPLLPGEVVLGDLAIENHAVLVPVPDFGKATSWTSRLPDSAPLALVHPKGVRYDTTWTFSASTDWHIAFDGRLSPVATPTWKPAPGDRLTVSGTRLPVADGQEVTIDRVDATLTTGDNRKRLVLSLSIRAARARSHKMEGPEGGVLESMRIDDTPRPMGDAAADVFLPLLPGTHRYELTWALPGNSRLFWPAAVSIPELDLGMTATNIRVAMEPPVPSWILFVWGPRLGPAILAWSWLVVLLAGAGACAFFLKKGPLVPADWFLLALGLVPLSPVGVLPIVGFFVLLRFRETTAHPGMKSFNGVQVGLVVLLLLSAAQLHVAIRTGLLGVPDMQVAGNGSSEVLLQWTADRTTGPLPSAGALLAGIHLWRGLMLFWALWLAFRLTRWSRHAFAVFTQDGFWRKGPAMRLDPELPTEDEDPATPS